MTIEAATYISQLNTSYPVRGDFLYEGDDQIRLIKAVIKNTFLNADEAMDLNLWKMALVPTGAIIAYNGDAAPTGWGLCDGSIYAKSDGSGNITAPDLRGKFIRGANPGVINRGTTGGAASVTPNTSTTGSHSHTATTSTSGAHTHTATTSTNGAHTHTATTSSNGSHSHTATTASSGDHSHGGATGSHILTISEIPAHNHGGGDHVHAQNGKTFLGSGAIQSGGSWGTPTSANTFGSGTIISTQGGGLGHTHSISTNGAHTHTLTTSTTGGHTHTLTTLSNGDHTHSLTTASSGGHTHTLTSSTDGSHFHTVTVDTIPPYYALTYIMKL